MARPERLELPTLRFEASASKCQAYIAFKVFGPALVPWIGAIALRRSLTSHSPCRLNGTLAPREPR